MHHEQLPPRNIASEIELLTASSRVASRLQINLGFPTDKLPLHFTQQVLTDEAAILQNIAYLARNRRMKFTDRNFNQVCLPYQSVNAIKQDVRDLVYLRNKLEDLQSMPTLKHVSQEYLAWCTRKVRILIEQVLKVNPAISSELEKLLDYSPTM